MPSTPKNMPKNILGLMSGTSLDGVDAALVQIDEIGNGAAGNDAAGNEAITRIASHFEPYTHDERAALRADLGAWEASRASQNAIHDAHNRAIGAIAASGKPIDLIGFHGQTLAHDAKAGRSYQAGDPAHLDADCPVVFDFRSADLAAGGSGAPLIPIYHYALARELGIGEPCVFINIGGVANITYVDPKERAERSLIAFDCGPGNAIMDDLIARARGAGGVGMRKDEFLYDDGGKLAASGKCDRDWVEMVLEHEYFSSPPPKSLDRNEFAHLTRALYEMPLEDALASAAALSVGAIRAAERHLPTPARTRIICGGGRKNAHILSALGGEKIDNFGLDGDMIEAEGFAYLAHRVVNGLAISFPGTTGCEVPMSGGQIHEPSRIVERAKAKAAISAA